MTKNIILLGSLLTVFCMSCGVEKSGKENLENTSINEVREELFSPLDNDELIIVNIQKEQNPESHYVELIIQAKKKDSQTIRELMKIAPKNPFGAPRIQGSKVYFLSGDPSYGGYTVVKFFDSLTGKIIDTGIKTYGEYALSSDSLYVAVVDRGKKIEDNWGSLYTPIVKIINFSEGDSKILDFSNTFLKEAWGADVLISFNEETKEFVLEYSLDSPGNLGTIYFNPYTQSYVLED